MTDELGTIGLDPVWVAANSLVDGRSPTAAEFAGFIGTGQMSRNARFTLDWGGGPGPATVVVKVPSAEEGTRTLSFDHGVYRRECEFYSQVAPLVDVAAPRALAVHFDEDGQDFAVVLEDLVGSEQGDQFTEPSDDQLVLAIEQAAALHAPVWGRTDSPALASYREDAEQRAGVTSLLPAFLDAVFERLGPGLEPDVLTMLERFAGLVDRWQQLRAEPVTLVHGDFRPDNFMFGVAEDAPLIMVVDWQTLTLGLGVTDVAYLLGAAITPERRRLVEHDMLARYREELAGRGITYSADQCLAEYALGSLHGVVVATLATTMADQTERGDALFTLMLNRHGRHALDFGVLDLVERSEK